MNFVREHMQTIKNVSFAFTCLFGVLMAGWVICWDWGYRKGRSLGFKRAYKETKHSNERWFNYRKSLYDLIFIQNVCNTERPKLELDTYGTQYKELKKVLDYKWLGNRIHQFRSDGEVGFIATFEIFTKDGSPLTIQKNTPNRNDQLIRAINIKAKSEKYRAVFGDGRPGQELDQSTYLYCSYFSDGKKLTLNKFNIESSLSFADDGENVKGKDKFKFQVYFRRKK